MHLLGLRGWAFVSALEGFSLVTVKGIRLARLGLRGRESHRGDPCYDVSLGVQNHLGVYLFWSLDLTINTSNRY